MFTGLLAWIAGRPAGAPYERAFVQDVRVQRRRVRNPRVERFVLICWLLIAVKHVLVIWVVHHYRMPFHQLLVNAPTWIFALLATLAYYWREE
ncbi:MAG: hypothetical protein C0518_14870 [Opitutus sp.]|nr:hypothetical protein [Opitutus sp.]